MDARSVIAALDGRWFGGYGVARCPAHHDDAPSLSICETKAGKLLVKCHAGCHQAAVIHILRSLGLWPTEAGASKSEPASSLSSDESKRTTAALKLWSSASPIGGTLAEHYLVSRGIVVPSPFSLRFHKALRHPTGQFLPAMVALVTNGLDGSAQAIHRTYLRTDGTGKASVYPQKAMLGPCRGGVVRLGSALDVELLVIGEGIESTLSAMALIGVKTGCAALSAEGLRRLALPRETQTIVIAADGDDVGEVAAQCCAQRLTEEARQVRIMHPPRGIDFNDVLLQGAGGQT